MTIVCVETFVRVPMFIRCENKKYKSLDDCVKKEIPWENDVK